MATLDKKVKAEQTINKYSNKLAQETIKQRKKETRRKIEFGGLVVKAKMDEYSKDVILGALIDAKEQLLQTIDVKKVFEVKGQKAFLETKRDTNDNSK